MTISFLLQKHFDTLTIRSSLHFRQASCQLYKYFGWMRRGIQDQVMDSYPLEMGHPGGLVQQCLGFQAIFCMNTATQIKNSYAYQ
jgi:hypothetical protein